MIRAYPERNLWQISLLFLSYLFYINYAMMILWEKYRAKVLFWILIFQVAFSGSIKAEGDFHILSSSEKGCVVAFSPAHFRLETLILNRKQYQMATFDMSSPWGEPGEPTLPCRVLVVGVPPRGDVSVTVDASDFVEKQGVRLAPMPELRQKDGMGWEVYQEGSAYQKSGFVPGPLFIADKPAFFGSQRIVRVRVYPVQYDPAEDKIRIYTKIIFQIHFTSEPSEDTVLKERIGQEGVFRKALINPSEAKKWRIRPERKWKKRSEILSWGERYKIPISEEGVYKITGAFLKNHDIDIAAIQPSTLKMYNNGGRELPRNLDESRPDSLIENPVLLVGMEDGRFDENDYLLFYGKGVKGWEYDRTAGAYHHYIHHYTDQNIYWLTFNDGKSGKRIPTVASPSGNFQQKSTFRDHSFLEQEIYNLLKGGIHWVGDQFKNGDTKSYKINLQYPVPDDTLRFRFQFQGFTSGTHQFHVQFNDALIETFLFAGTGLTLKTAVLVGQAKQGENTLSFQYSGSGLEPEAYLDWFELDCGRMLRNSGGRLRFFSPLQEGFFQYILSGFGEKPQVWDVTDISNISSLELSLGSDGLWAFADSAFQEAPKTYLAFETSGIMVPNTIQKDEMSDLRNPANGSDLIIVVHRDFYNQALRLKALREEHDSLTVFIADIQDVYDEFGWGLFDPVAIRDFVKYACEDWTIRPTYLLLFGDGDYDYRNFLSNQDKNWIPPFEYDGLTDSGTRASDDWYTYVTGTDFYMDLAVGRLPVQSEEQARAVVDKIVQYETNPAWGDWKNLVTLIGDDEKGQFGDENEITHIRATEDMAENTLPQFFNFEKIYLTEYPEEFIGRRVKPKVNEDLVEQINRGTLWVNYIGHGNQKVWAHEWIFRSDSDLPRLNNREVLPLFYAATCSFAWYDNPEEQSFGEELLYAEGKGGVGVIAASRLCSSGANEALNKAFATFLFSSQGPTERIGDALRLAKLFVTSTVNNEMYHILGDPTMRLGVPQYRAEFTSVEPDTFKALSVVTVQGQMERDGIPWTDFNGTVALKVFDSKRDILYTTQYGTELPYRLSGNAIFRGETRAENGQFQISFVVPKDISYGGHSGRIGSYFWGNDADGAGYRDNIEIGGSSDLVDIRSPEIELYFTENENFVSGGMVLEDPELVAVVRDDTSGINITGEIGHKILLTLDTENKVDVTDYFQYNEGSYLEGKLQYQLTNIGEGEHNLSLKVWDNANNSSTQFLEFRVVPRGELLVEDVLNYPNPMSTSTYFTFKLNRDAEVDIKIFTVDGRLIKRMEGILGEPGFNMIAWNGRDEEGDELANGVYLYKVNATAHAEGKDLKKEAIGRLMIMR